MAALNREHDGADHGAEEGDERYGQMHLARGGDRVPGGVVGKEGEDSRPDSPDGEKCHPYPEAVAPGRNPQQRCGESQGEGTTEQEVEVHQPGVGTHAVVALGTVEEAQVGSQEGQQDVDE